MDEKSLEILEFPRIREILAGFTSFSASRELATELGPLSDYELISLLLNQSREARQLLSLEPDFTIGGVLDIRDTVGMAARDKILEPQELLEVQGTLAAMRHLRAGLAKMARELPLLWRIASGIVELRYLEKEIGRCLAPTGEVLDSASPYLAEIRQQLKEVRHRLLSRLEVIVHSPGGQKLVQEPIITERDGRYVIPVKTEVRREIEGIVHDISNTGATVFVEPWSTIGLGNELRELVTEEKHEVEKILRGLSTRVGERDAEIRENVTLAAELDLALAKARYARKVGATEATIVSWDEGETGVGERPDGVLKLIGARHPLLGERAVPLSLEIGRDFSILIITGPNTGGKTVALKTIGLLALMTQAGLPIPASGESVLLVFDSVFADIGDEQSIEQTLSTFSWHMGNIVRIIGCATRESLVLLDELGISTDPAEGSALARAMLLHFLSRGVLTVATTHYGDLKAFAHTTQGLENASLDFDPVTLLPTYQLSIGIPGGSNALATASRLGLPGEIVSRARSLLSEGAQELEKLLTDLMAEKERHQVRSQELETVRAKVEQESAELENELKQLAAQKRRIIQETRDSVISEAAALTREVRRVALELRKEKSKERVEATKRVLATVREKLEGETWQTEVDIKSDEELTDDSLIQAGDTVWLKEANLEAKVLSVSEETREVEVQAGQSRLSLGLDRVAKVPAGSATVVKEAVSITREPEARIVSRELDLRGRRADEVEWALDSYLNDASLTSLGEVRIIHGVGTGTVRSIVRDFLASHPLVNSFRPGRSDEGGDGVTVARL